MSKNVCFGFLKEMEEKWIWRRREVVVEDLGGVQGRENCGWGVKYEIRIKKRIKMNF